MGLGEIAENIWFGFIVLGGILGAIAPIGMIVWILYEILK